MFNRRLANHHSFILFFIVLLSFSCKTVQRSKLSDSGNRLEIITTSDKRSSLNQPADSTMSAWKSEYLDQTRVNPRDANAWGKLAKIAVAEKDLKSANVYAYKAISYDINQFDAKTALVQISVTEGDLPKAKVLLASLENQQKPSAELLHLRGLILAAEKDDSGAAAAWEQALALDPTLVATRMNLGILQLRYFQFRSAAGHFQRILSSMPQNQDAKLHLGIAMAGYGDLKGAAALYDEVASDQSKNPIYLFNYGVLLKKNGELERSLGLLESYLGQTKASSTSQRERAMELVEETKDLIEARKTQNLAASDLSKLSKTTEAKASTKSTKTKVKKPAKKTKDSYTNDLDKLEEELLK